MSIGAAAAAAGAAAAAASGGATLLPAISRPSRSALDIVKMRINTEEKEFLLMFTSQETSNE